MWLVCVRYTIAMVLFFETTIGAVATAKTPYPVAAVTSTEETHDYYLSIYLFLVAVAIVVVAVAHVDVW